MSYTAIQDHVGRTIIGKLKDETETTLTITNPVILHCQPLQDGQLQVQSFPVFFFEFINKGDRDKNDWTYHKASIVTSNVVLTEQIVAQYEQINTPKVEAAAKTKPNIVSINDL